MAKLSKYSKLRPKVSLLTYIILGLVFVGLTLTIILSIDTPKQKFNKQFSLEDNNIYEISTLKKINKKIEAGEEVLALFVVEPSESSPAAFINHLDTAYRVNEEGQEDNQYKGYVDLEKLPKTVYYVVIDAKQVEDFNEYLDEIDSDKNKIIKSRSEVPLVLYFKNKELSSAFNNKEHSDLHSANKETAQLIRNLRDFLEEIQN